VRTGRPSLVVYQVLAGTGQGSIRKASCTLKFSKTKAIEHIC